MFTQEVVSNGGEYFSNANGSFSWTLGEPVTETVNSGTNILTQGFQQDFENLLGLQFLTNNESIGIYPNPFVNDVFLKCETCIQGDINLSLCDTRGRVINNKLTFILLSENALKVDLSGLSVGVYFIKISIDQNIGEQLFRIVKSN